MSLGRDNTSRKKEVKRKRPIVKIYAETQWIDYSEWYRKTGEDEKIWDVNFLRAEINEVIFSKGNLIRIICLKRVMVYQRDGMGREVGGGFRIGNTCTPVADSCWCMTKPIQYCKAKKKQTKKATSMIALKKRSFQHEEKK